MLHPVFVKTGYTTSFCLLFNADLTPGESTAEQSSKLSFSDSDSGSTTTMKHKTCTPVELSHGLSDFTSPTARQ